MQGLVTTTTDVLPKVWKGVFQCKRCKQEVEVIQSRKGLKGPVVCEGCGRKEFELDEERSKYIDFQKIQVQEPLEILKGGDQAKRISVWLEEDLIKKRVVPGQRLIISGMLRLEAPKQKGTVYQKFVEANNIEFTEQEFEELEITEDEEKKIKNILDAKGEIVATGNPGCLLQILSGIKKHKSDLTVVHTIEILDMAYQNAKKE
jgi:replicative DNA helicase Mcm